MSTAETPMSISALLNPAPKTQPDVLPANIYTAVIYTPPYLDKGSMDCHYNNIDSAPSKSIARRGRRRPHRPEYSEEEMYFIWYHRVDLGMTWNECVCVFNGQFPSSKGRPVQGLQGVFYRFIKSKGCPTVRQQHNNVVRRDRDGLPLPHIGVIEWCGISYPWMRLEHRYNCITDWRLTGFELV
ncbi:uncharacterized protein TRUGW13939_08790 [Talaromyces rugulosus]|uniref:Uncharacterized protein n=1 Tax=Talaromyces rugulosus TaxID=121627 RepID=A0A7H8R6Q9_TALRU|nr:uncharacterized protein TRUGW13939_08790 [Talaromyces rugulosus]QKX61638.1 hypothetical protein TRUGW13939_08790 [Talaromyces rugulosus]